MTHVHIVFAHPADRGFTREVLAALQTTLTRQGHTHTLSDLYAMGFRTELSAAEYARESAYRTDLPVADDVAAEQARLAAADMWAFVYPVWWADCPAILKGWFDRVWTAGFAHHTGNPISVRKAVVLCTAGHPLARLEADGLYQAMRATMLIDRIGTRADEAGFILLTRDDNPAEAVEGLFP
ncbi:NAD(P)H-dependent oxidoreductase [Actinoplanes bogorensis]|uniref:NAD(P)H-dependent oxidoreductase n=1 Tax=Paractinoplanes bogorensis TaxID=1610840 RepID=A0ABS5Z3Z7_9ACTN|nr:NAD(P)H-dependent oxidoreductase [Actinoplanes bogorensis]MBU2669135.1 NAD(P)H-dependent oxidoreductase [Actinoplanes bogorensis]